MKITHCSVPPNLGPRAPPDHLSYQWLIEIFSGSKYCNRIGIRCIESCCQNIIIYQKRKTTERKSSMISLRSTTGVAESKCLAVKPINGKIDAVSTLRYAFSKN